MSTKINITMAEREALIKEIHANAVAKGFWDEKHSEQHCLMLVITELSEAVEADRRDNYSYRRGGYKRELKVRGLDFDEALFLEHVKDSVEDELADALIRVYDVIGAYGYDLSVERIRRSRDLVLLDFYERQVRDFAEQVLECVRKITLCAISPSRNNYCDAIATIEAVAIVNQLNFYWHVREKMKYNATRPPLHGKKY